MLLKFLNKRIYLCLHFIVDKNKLTVDKNKHVIKRQRIDRQITTQESTRTKQLVAMKRNKQVNKNEIARFGNSNGYHSVTPKSNKRRRYNFQMSPLLSSGLIAKKLTWFSRRCVVAAGRLVTKISGGSAPENFFLSIFKTVDNVFCKIKGRKKWIKD